MTFKKRLKICLINPPSIVPSGLAFSGIFEPLGLAYIAAVLEQNGYDVSILDAPALACDKFHSIGGSHLVGLTYEEITAYIERVCPDIVGISVLFSVQARSAYLTASAVKRANRNITVVLGGIHASVKPLECLEQPDVDIVVIGEGEYTMLHIVKALETSRARLSGVSNIAYRENGVAKITTKASPIMDLDSLPLPAYHLLPLEHYYKAAKAARCAELTDTLNRRWAQMVTSRGCPYQCVFCSIHLHMGRSWRPRSPENVVNEIEQLVQRYGVEVINFEDDNIALNKERLTQICDLIMERGLKFQWNTPNGIRADALDEELLRKMRASGCRRIVLAPESGNQQVLNRIIHKNMDLSKVEEAVGLCKKLGLRVTCFFIVGLIGETKENMLETIAFARKLRKLGATKFSFSVATPYYGTALYEQAEKLGYLRTGADEYMIPFNQTIETPEFSLEEMRQLYRQALRINPLIPRDDLGIILKILVNDPLRAIQLAVSRITGFRTGA